MKTIKSDFKLVSLTQDLIEGPKDQLVPFEYKENKALLSHFFTLALSFTIQYKVTKTEIKMDCIERDKTHQVLTFLSVYYIKYIFNIQAMLAKTLTMNRPISNVRSKSLFLMFNILQIKHQCCLLHRSAICMWNCGSYYCLPSYEANFHYASSVHTVKFTIHFNSISNFLVVIQFIRNWKRMG